MRDKIRLISDVIAPLGTTTVVMDAECVHMGSSGPNHRSQTPKRKPAQAAS